VLTTAHLKEVIADQRMIYHPLIEVPRAKFEKALELAETPQILIITGVRRSGKSTLMQQLRKSRQEQDFYLSFEDDRLASFSLSDFQLLLEVFIELFGPQKTFYFDEIQNIPGWEKFIRRLYEQGNKIIITGSNANLLSSELGTHLTGRYLTLELFPYSFEEYCIAKKHPVSTLDYFNTEQRALCKKWSNEYQAEGGFPEYLQYLKPEYLTTLYESILYRDIINRYKIPQEKPIKELVLFLSSNIGKTVTYNSLRKIVGLASGTTVAEYCQYLENCYLFFIVQRYDFSLKAQIQSPKKSYIIDTALAGVLGFRISADKGRFLENMAFLELKRRNVGMIYYHQGKHECDFVIREGNAITQAIQVTQSLEDASTKEREYAGLLDAMRIYGLSSGLILTENQSFEETIDNYKIVVMPLWRWLLNK